MNELDFEKIKRLNSLAFEFRKHNLADNHEGALDQVGEMLQEKKEAPQTEKILTSPAENEDAYLLEKKFDFLLQTINSKTEQQFKALGNSIESLRNELESVKSELRRIPDEFQKKKAKEKEAEAQKVLKTEPKEEHPRQGKFSSEDVRIDKFFYYGK